MADTSDTHSSTRQSKRPSSAEAKTINRTPGRTTGRTAGRTPQQSPGRRSVIVRAAPAKQASASREFLFNTICKLTDEADWVPVTRELQTDLLKNVEPLLKAPAEGKRGVFRARRKGQTKPAMPRVANN